MNYKKSLCYYCGSPFSSKEHAPPQLLFRGFSCDSITVPSCESHNSSKSGDDQAFISALIQSLNNLQLQENTKFSPDVVKAIATAKSSFECVKESVKNVDIIEREQLDSTIFSKVAHFQGNIDNWIRQLTAALVWNAIKYFDKDINWSKSVVRSPNLIHSDVPSNLDIAQVLESTKLFQQVDEMEQKLTWINGWSAHPKPYPTSIYRFSLFFDDGENSIIVKHRFYDCYSWYILFSAPKQTMDTIKEKALFNSSKQKN